MPGVHWSKEVQVKYSKEEVDWLTARIKEHRGPSLVFMHSPPFSAGYHRMDWEMDDIMRQRRDQIVSAMTEHQIPVTYVVFPDEGHGFARRENDKAFNAVTEAFLAQQLGGRFQPVGQDFDGSTITVPTGADQVPGLVNALSGMKHGNEQAECGAAEGATTK